MIGRRTFITLVGTTAVSGFVRARAERAERIARVGILMSYMESDPAAQSYANALQGGLAELGWQEGAHVRFERRWAAGDSDLMRAFAKELVDLPCDLIVANTTPATSAVHKETSSIPVVFVIVSDPVGAGFVASMSRPGGNITGFINIEGSMGGKWLELLKEAAPRLRRSAIMFNPDTAPGKGAYFLPAFEAAARALKVEPITVAVRSAADIEQTMGELARAGDAGLVVSADAFLFVQRQQIISLSLQHRIPVVNNNPDFARQGGVLSYGASSVDVFRRAAGYVDRILRGAKPADLPVQVPTKFELIINLKTARATGLTISESLLMRADEVIE